MADARSMGMGEQEVWFRGHVPTRFFATICVAVGSMDAIVHLSWPSAVEVAIAAVIAISIWREWPSWRRMGRLLRHGT